MAIYDISLTLSDQTPEWPSDNSPLEFRKISRIADGQKANVTQLSMCAHTGTHVDAPCHFVDKAGSVESLPLESLIGEAYVMDLPDVELITQEVLEKECFPEGALRILFKTRNSQKRLLEQKAFHKNYVSLDVSAATFLVDRGVKLVGIDYLSIAPFDDLIPTHQTLLNAGVVVVESLNLTGISEGSYSLYCLPIKIAGSDGAPARVILIDS